MDNNNNNNNDDGGGGVGEVKIVVPDDFQRVTLTATNVRYSIKKHEILKGVDLICEPGEVLAVVGPSGAGKTTLLNCLALRTKGGTRTGSINLNGVPATTKFVKESCNYVMTDGRMLPYLTVHETLVTAAKLKLPLMSKEDRLARVDKVIWDLGLQNCRDTFIGGEWKKGISTGERKRVCIAIEMLAEPSVLILDEPTSGLDSKLACELLSVIQRVADSGRSIVISIHQPTSQMWSMFDKLLLLAKGEVAYFGSASTAKEHFQSLGHICPKNYNPADFFLCLVSNDLTEMGLSSDSNDETTNDGQSNCTQGSEIELAMSPSAMVRAGDAEGVIAGYMASPAKQNLKKRIANFEDCGVHETVKVPPQKRTCSQRSKIWFGEIGALFKRSFKNSIRNPIVCCVMLLVQALQGLILGGIFWQLTSDVATQSPYIDFKPIVESGWGQVFINGVDGHQPLLEFLENGVDQKGSQPLVTLWNNPHPIGFGYETAMCGIPQAQYLEPYPQFGVRPDVAPMNETESEIPEGDMEQITPFGTSGILVGGSQVLDYHCNMMDWTMAMEQWPEDDDDSIMFYTAGAYLTRETLINPFLGCAGFKLVPPFDGDETKKSAQKVDEPGAKRRRLITIGDIGINDAFLDLLGIGGAPMAEATKEIFNRLRNCENEACGWIDSKATSAEETGKDLYAAGMAVVNILGALYFAVANLGFSSYDALLTFPQERALFNRESASGLYSASSYFIAKNLADLPFQLIPGAVLVTIFYFMAGLGGAASQFFIYFVVCAGVTFAAYGFGYLVSAASPRMEIAVLAAPVTLVIWLTIAGFFLRDNQIPSWIAWFSYLSFYKWGFFSLVLNQFPLGGYFGVLPNDLAVFAAGISDTRIGVTIALLFTLGFGYRILAFFALKYTNRTVGVGY